MGTNLINLATKKLKLYILPSLRGVKANRQLVWCVHFVYISVQILWLTSLVNI